MGKRYWIKPKRMLIELMLQLQRNEAAQEKAGHSGTPLMVFKGEPFFGQDRIKLLIWRLKESGLRARNSSG
jgi:2-hydroxychromene-2-carboxylate isomerase